MTGSAWVARKEAALIMQQYILKRLLFSVPVVFFMLVLLFLLVNAMPGDVVDNLLAGSGLTADEIALYKHDVGLDRPVHERFLRWLGGLFQGDLGKSIFTGRSVKDELIQRAPATIELGLLALALSMVIAIPLGIISAIRPNTPVDYVSRFVAIFGLSVPEFIIGVMAILLVSKYLGFFPTVGYVAPWDDPVENLNRLWMPVLILGFRQSAAVARMLRSSLLEVLHSDYIRTAWSKGLKERVIVIRHAVRNAMIPVVTIIGLQARAVIGGVVILEVLFSIPGMGSLLVESVFRRDLVPVQTVVLIFALVVVAVNLLVDISYSWLDPRIRQT